MIKVRTAVTRRFASWEAAWDHVQSLGCPLYAETVDVEMWEDVDE
jgi:hypothetical protein